MEKTLTFAPEIVTMFGMNKNTATASINTTTGTMETEVRLPITGVNVFTFDIMELVFTFRKNDSGKIRQQQIAHRGSVSLKTIQNIGAPNLKVKTTPLYYPIADDQLLGGREPIKFFVDETGYVTLAPKSK